MKPKTFDVASKRAEFLQSEAVRAEANAFQAEAYADFYDEWKAASDPIRTAAREKAIKARKYADIAISRGKPSQKDLTETRRVFLDNWLSENKGRILENQERIALKEEMELDENDEPPISEEIIQPDGQRYSKPVTIREHLDNIEMFQAAVTVAEKLFAKIPERKPAKMNPKLKTLKGSDNGKENLVEATKD